MKLRPSLRRYYHNYTDAFGDPAGDYLGALTQMDAQVGRLRALLRELGVANDTLVWYAADNGPHTLADDGASGRGLGVRAVAGGDDDEALSLSLSSRHVGHGPARPQRVRRAARDQRAAPVQGVIV